MKQSIVRSLAALVVLGLVLGLLLLSRERGGESAQLDAAAGAELVREPLAGTDHATPSAQASENASAREIAPETAPASTAPAPVDSILVRVVDCERFEPVVGAEVRWASLDWIWGEGPKSTFDSPGLEARVRESGLVGTTDEHGLVGIEAARSVLLVQASLPGLWGQIYASPASPETLELVLAPDGDLRVEIVDPAGAPVARVRVGVRKASDLQGSIKAHAFTGLDGVARIPHARALLLASATQGPLLVTALTADPDAPRALVELSPWPTLPVQLVLRPSGTVVVNVVDSAGANVSIPADVQLTVSLPGARHSVRSESVIDGAATFEHVPLGASLAIACTARLGSKDSCEGTQAVGPRTAGERVVVTSTLCDTQPMFVGRILDGNGEPLASAAIQLSLREAAHLVPYADIAPAKTDAAGRFRAPLEHKADAGPTERVLLVRASWTGLEGLAAVSGIPEHGDVEVGDVRLALAPRLVAGRVLDQHGAPIVGASLSLRRFQPSAQADESLELGYGAGTDAWLEDSLRTARTDEHGRFELRARDALGPYALRVYALGFSRGQQVRFEPVASDVVLVLERNVDALRGRLLAPTNEAFGHVQVSAGAMAGTIDAFGRFAIPRSSAAPVDVLVRVDGFGPEPLVTIPGVSDAKDPRLAAIDLRGLVREFSFRVVGSDGMPLRTVRVSGYSRAGSGWQFTSSGYVGMLTHDTTLDLGLSADGYAPASFVGVRSGDVLKLERLPALLLRVPEHLPEAGDGLVYVVQATLEGSPLARTTIQSDREAYLRLGGPGKWNVQWVVRGSKTVLSQVELVVGHEDVECVLDAKSQDVESAIAEARARRK